jgi:hypothetical protein
MKFGQLKDLPARMVSIIGPLAVECRVYGKYTPVRPSVFGQWWNIQVSLAPVIPKLVKNSLLGD